MSDLEQTLAQRGAVYGRFVDQSQISQGLKRVMRAAPGWQELPDDMREALEMVQHKVARILNGNPCYIDTWRDSIGYLQLVIDGLRETEGSIDSQVIISRRVAEGWVDAK